MKPGTILGFPAHVFTETYSEFGLLQPDKTVSELERRYRLRDSAFVEIGDSRVHYAQRGAPENPTLLMLHGTYSSLHTWDGWVEELADDFHLVRLDLPGFGLTGPRRSGELTFEYVIDTVGAFADVLGLTDVTLVGNSLGGGIAWRVSVDRPDLVSRLVLVDAGGASLLARLAGNFSSLGNDLFARFVTPRVAVRLIVRDAYADKSKVTPELVRRYHDLLLRPGNRRSVVEIARNYAADHPVEAAEDTYDPWVPALPSSYDPSPEILDEYDIGDVSVPTLFQWGEEDGWLPVHFGRSLASKVAGHQFLLYEGVGHVPMEEAPVRTARDAAQFVRQRDAAK